MKNRKLIMILILLPLSVTAAVVAYISWLFPLKEGTKSSIFVPLWGKILLCKLATTGLELKISTPEMIVESNNTVATGLKYSNDFFYLSVQGTEAVTPTGVHTNLVTLQNDDIKFTYGSVFDAGYLYLTKKLYDTETVSWKLFLTEYNKYKNEIKKLKDE